MRPNGHSEKHPVAKVWSNVLDAVFPPRRFDRKLDEAAAIIQKRADEMHDAVRRRRMRDGDTA
jgi:hypothetical protein